MKFLEINKLCKSFKNQNVLNNISLSFNLNEIIFIIGESGCGKSTLLNCIGLNEDWDYGSIYINGKLVKEKNKQNLKYNYFSYMYQDDYLIPYLTIKENILITNKSIEYSDLEDMSSKLGIKEFLDCYPETLSGGERQRASLCRTLVNYPKIILCDEPTSSLDEENATNVMELLKRNSEGKLIIVSTHDIELAKKYATKIIYLENHQVVEKENLHSDFNVNKAQSNVTYKSRKIKNVILDCFKSFKNNVKIPLLTSIFMSLCLFVLMGLIGIYTSINDFIDYEIKNRLDSNYYEFDKINGENANYLDILDGNDIKYIEFDNLNYLFNNFIKSQFSLENNINFTYSFSVIDFSNINFYHVSSTNNNPKVLANSSFFENNLSNDLNFKIDLTYLNYSINIEKTLSIDGEAKESKIYNSSKIYIDYSYAIQLLSNDFVNYVFHEQDSIIIAKYVCILSNLTELNKLLSKNESYISYLNEDYGNKIIYTSSNLIIDETVRSLISSFFYIFICVVIILGVSMVMLFNLIISYLLKRRKVEYTIKRSFGYKNTDIKFELFIQSLVLTLFSLFLSYIFYYLLHLIINEYSLNVLQIGYKYDLLPIDAISFSTGAYVSIVIALLSSILISKKTLNMNIMEVLKNE